MGPRPRGSAERPSSRAPLGGGLGRPPQEVASREDLVRPLVEVLSLARPLPEEGASGGQGLMRSPGEVLGDDGLLGPRQALGPGPKADGPGYPGFHGPDSHKAFLDLFLQLGILLHKMNMLTTRVSITSIIN